MSENVVIRKVKKSEKQIIKNLFQLYSYDFSEMYLDDVDENGLFKEYTYMHEYFTDDKDRAAYLIMVDDKIAGFFMMNKYPILSPEGSNSIAEFFIMRKYRQGGFGLYAANYIFDNYPGDMEIKVLENNISAIIFWDKAIKSNAAIKQHAVSDANVDGVNWIVHSIVI